MDARCRVELFGWLRVEQAGRVITRFRSYQTGALLAYLAFYRQRSHPREILIELLWPGCDPASGRDRLSTALSSLRHQLEPPGVPAGVILIADRASVQLNPAACNTDVAEFEAALQSVQQTHRSGRTGVTPSAIPLLIEAVDLYRGELLPGFYEDWNLTERARLSEAYLQTLHLLTARMEQAQEWGRALDYARRAVREDPLREQAHCDLIRLSIAAGETAQAQQQYRDLERILKQELGISPGPATQALIQSMIVDCPVRSDSPLLPPSPLLSPPQSMFSIGALTVLMMEWEPAADADSSIDNLLREVIRHHSGYLIEGNREERRGNRADEGVGYRVSGVGEKTEGEKGRRGDGEKKQEGKREEGRGKSSEAEQSTIDNRQSTISEVAVFGRAGDALACAVACRRALEASGHRATAAAPLLRTALHTAEMGTSQLKTPSIPSHSALEYAARILLAAQNGQILCSETTAALLRQNLPPDLRLSDLGVYRLRGANRPERLFEAIHPDRLPQSLPGPDAEPIHPGKVPTQFTRFFGRDSEIAQLLTLLQLPAGENKASVTVSSLSLSIGQDVIGESDNADNVSLSPLLPFSPTRLITLTGAGGTGKTRLALEVAKQLLEPFRGAVWFVPLAERHDSRLIIEAIMDTVGLAHSAGSEPFPQVVETLSRQPCLLVLDNFEQLLREDYPADDESALIVRKLLDQAPSLFCLVTSRQRLGLHGEREYPLAPLPIPAGPSTPAELTRYASVQLFVDRAQAVRPDFQLTRGNAGAVAELCERLEGLPLAIELAAARSQMLTPAQMLGQLENRFDFLVSRQRDVAYRHRTLRGAIDWSYELLAPELQRFFARLSVFRGGWTLEAAEFVCGADTGVRGQGSGVREVPSPTSAKEVPPELQNGMWQLESLTPDVLDCLAQLRECSLVMSEESLKEVAGEMYFRQLETIREYAETKLATEEKERLQARHAHYFLELAEKAEPQLQGAEQAQWLSLLEWSLSEGKREEGRGKRSQEEHSTIDNRQSTIALRLCCALGRFWTVRGYWSEGREWLRRALSQAGGTGSSALRAQALDWAGNLAASQGDYALACALLEESLAMRRELEDKTGIATSLHMLGNLTYARGDSVSARALYEQSLALRRELDETRSIAPLLNNLGNLASEQGDHETARTLHQESLRLRRQMEDRRGVASSLHNLGYTVWHLGDQTQARLFLEESLEIRQELGDKLGIADSLCRLGYLLLHEGDFESARASLEMGLAVARELGRKPGFQ